MQTNRRTFCSSLMTPPCTNPSVISTPNTGITSILPTASHVIAASGRSLHWLSWIFIRARADPKQINPRGTLAAPMKEQVSIMNASGGCPSGAFGIGELSTATKSAFRGLTREMRRATRIESAWGVRREESTVRMNATVLCMMLCDRGEAVVEGPTLSGIAASLVLVDLD